MKVSLAYRYCTLDKQHEYHFGVTDATPEQQFWFGWHLAKLVKRKIHLYPWIPNWCKVKKLGSWSQNSASDAAGYVARAILKNKEIAK